MDGRVLLSIALVTMVSAVVPSGAAPAASPLAASMCVDTSDFAHGGVVVSEGTRTSSTFPKFPATSSYSRDFRNVAVGRATLVTLGCDAAIAKRPSDPARWMSELITITHPGSGRQQFLQGVKRSLPKTEKNATATIVRARVVRVGDSTVDILVRLKLKDGTVEVGQLWIEVGPVLEFMLYVTAGRGMTAGDAVKLAGAAASHAKLALEPAPTNTSAPEISGTPQLGQTLTATPGTWKGTVPKFEYQWLRCTAACATIPGATSVTYAVATADQGATLVVSVTAITRAGSANARSAPTPTVI